MALDRSEDTEFVKFWNSVLEPKFTKYRHILQGGLSRHSAAVLPKLPIEAGMAVLDVGCGWGDLSLQIAERVGPEGRVVGIDCVEAFLKEARADAKEAGFANVEFRRGDAEIALPENEFDYVVSRFGTMFFTNPVAALRRMRLALKPGGQMTHIVWRRREDNPAWQTAKDIALRHLPPPGEDADTCGPGPFSMGNPEMVETMMKSAGYEDVSFTRVDEKIMVGTTPDECIAFALAIGPAGEVFREAGEELAEAKRADIEDEMRRFFESQERNEAGIWVPTSSWVISARNPA
ncbi:class I SAM-dependent methyltransferase [Psychromarinibacter sp. C21-152]|uniref:Class I SAM-dependent methyltransferase n=1 Tax=Psychromarinibacter sediminicola TaxID=3033385 RepID=A0AAE3NXM2_9RHOB|nr:class I SAM-dependent methyltransferase [Psychromarinibacter sediminicola]MDF0603509.1 class I SAM-dependent methyltransferase [Psychromarinibacter sediminicola]